MRDLQRSQWLRGLGRKQMEQRKMMHRNGSLFIGFSPCRGPIITPSGMTFWFSFHFNAAAWLIRRLHAFLGFPTRHNVFRLILWIHSFWVPATLQPLSTWPHHEVPRWLMQYSVNRLIVCTNSTILGWRFFVQQQFNGYRVAHFTKFKTTLQNSRPLSLCLLFREL